MSNILAEGQNKHFWALLVGIDEYAVYNNLDGCVNDVEAMKIFLVNQLHVPDSPNIRVLTNQEANRENFLRVFQEHLIDNENIQRDDQILFHYSGHGAYMTDPLNVEPNGYWESLVAHDSGQEDVYNIPDKTIAALLDQLAAKKGSNITVILDSCHSGSGTRETDNNGPKIRLTEPDTRIPPATLDQKILAAVTERGGGASGWGMDQVPYTLLAACRDRELASEYRDHDGGKMVTYGALSYFLIKALEKIVTPISYAELHELIAPKVNTFNPYQMPQVEGNRNRQIFDGMQIDRDPFIQVRSVADGKLTVNAGLIHGLRSEAEMALYPQSVRTIEELDSTTPIATAKVISVSASSATAEIIEPEADMEALQSARAIMTTQVYVGLRQRVVLRKTADPAMQQVLDELHTAIMSAGPQGTPSTYLELIEDEETAVDLIIEAVDDNLSIYAGNGIDPLVAPEPITAESEHIVNTVNSLEAIARYQRLMKLENEESGSALTEKLRLRLRHYERDIDPSEMTLVEPNKNNEIVLPFDPEQEHHEYSVEIVNGSSKRIYPHVLIMNPDFGIELLYPRIGGEVAVDPRRSLYLGYDTSEEIMDIYLPEDWDASRDKLKLFATTAPSDFAIFEQEGLQRGVPKNKAPNAHRSVLDQLFDETVDNSGKRHSRPKRVAPSEDWATATLAYTVVKKSKTTVLVEGETEVALGEGLQLQKPSNFKGELSITSQGNGLRSADGDPDLKPPPGLAAQPERFQSLARTGKRGVGSADLILRLDVEEADRASITSENTLKLMVDDLEPEVEELIPVAFDGEDYLVVGYTGDGSNEVVITQLPERVGEPTQRGIFRTVKLFVYKKLGRHSPTVGLRAVDLVDGEPVYSEVGPSLFQAGERVALLVHGFSSDTRRMAQLLLPYLRSQGAAYDHFLTWDYETYGTTIEETATTFAQELRSKCGFGPDDGITLHIMAHSMGCLVSRALIELVANTDFVDKLVMAGPPNAGTALANHAKMGIYLVTTAINFASALPVVDVFNTALKTLNEEGRGAADLKVGSDFVVKLNGLSAPSRVPYLVLAGENQVDAKKLAKLNRLAVKILDTTMDHLFNEQNDLVVGLSQMKGVRNGDYPKLKIVPLDCDHFHYFSIDEGRDAIRTFLLS